MRNSKLAALRAAFPYTVSIFTGFWFLAMAYGIQTVSYTHLTLPTILRV